MQRMFDGDGNVMIMEAKDASGYLLDGLRSGFEKTFLRAAENFTWLEADALLGDDKVIALVVEADEVTAGLYYERTVEGEIPVPCFKGVFSNSPAKGRASQLITSSLAYEAARQDQTIGALATIRIRKDGSVNPAMSKVLGRLGFYPRERGVYPLNSSARLRHLVPTANRFDEAGTPIFEVLHMALTPRDAAKLIS